MIPLDPSYYRILQFGQIPTTDNSHLSSDGRIRPLTPFQIIPGSPATPGDSHYGDERTGRFWDGIARLGTSIFGQRRFVQCDAGIECWDVYGALQGLMGPTNYLAEASVDITAGLAVSVYPGVLTVPKVALASTPAAAVGVAAWTVPMGSPVLVSCGILTIPDWTAAVGNRLLTNSEYFLGASGQLVTSSGTQWVLTALGPTQARIRCYQASIDGGGA